MSDYQATYDVPRDRAMQTTFFASVFGWMAFALALTGVSAYLTANNEALLRIVVPYFMWFLIGELALVFGISFGINRISAGTATALFIVYAVVNGLTLSLVLRVYTAASVAQAFFITAGMFGGMCAYGYYTKRDLTSVGSIAYMALFGLIIASVVNIFLRNEAMYWLLSYVGVVIFVALTAYHAQKVKRLSDAGIDDAEMHRKASIVFALALYLDFVNIFLYMLRFFGKRR
jgi:FtsH-binding integral membrane protein